MLYECYPKYPRSVILSGAKIPICHPRAQRRILIEIFAKSKFCGSRMRCQAHRSKQNRRRRDLCRFLTRRLQKLHSIVICKGEVIGDRHASRTVQRLNKH